MPDERVALLIETSTSWGQQIIAGVGDYVRRHRRWILHVDYRGTYEPQAVPAGWTGDGIIARLTTPESAAGVLATGLPCVNVSTMRPPAAEQIQRVTIDEIAVGRLGADTLVNAGMSHFGYFGPPTRAFYHDDIGQAYLDRLAELGHAASSFVGVDRILRATDTADPRVGHELLAQWVRSLPKPVGILCWNALGARHVAEICCWLKVDVPAEAAILGGDYDQLTAEIAQPQLSCVDKGPRRLGFLAAGQLDRLMAGGEPTAPILGAPAGVIFRDSVHDPKVHDPIVDEALRLIRQHATGPFDIERLLGALSVSRRSLEARFQRVLGHGPVAELRQVRLAEALRLLESTDLPIKEVVFRSGLGNPEQLQRLVREATSLSPSQYRQANRPAPSGHDKPMTHRDVRDGDDPPLARP
jgi:LacI family transcriptional regulator